MLLMSRYLDVALLPLGSGGYRAFVGRLGSQPTVVIFIQYLIAMITLLYYQLLQCFCNCVPFDLRASRVNFKLRFYPVGAYNYVVCACLVWIRSSRSELWTVVVCSRFCCRAA